MADLWARDFRGGPRPLYPSRQPASLLDRQSVYIDPEAWPEVVRYGAAGDRADTPEEQMRRYTKLPNFDPACREVNPGLAEHLLEDPDIFITCSFDYTIKTWDAQTYAPLQTFEGHQGFVNAAVPYPGGRIISVSDDFTLRVWKLGEAGTPGRFTMVRYVNRYCLKCVVGLPGERAAAGELHSLYIISLVNGATLHKIDDHTKTGPDANYWQKEGCGVVWALLHLRGNVLVSGSDDSTIRVWDIDTGACLTDEVKVAHEGYGDDVGEKAKQYKLSSEFAAILKLAHLGDGKTFASSSFDRCIAVWDGTDARSLACLWRWRAADNSVLDMCFVDESHIAVCSADSLVTVWDWRKRERAGHVLKVRAIPQGACRLDDRRLVVAGGDATLRIFDWQSGAEVKFPKEAGGETGVAGGFYAHDFTIRGVVGTSRPSSWHLVGDESPPGDSSPTASGAEPIMYQTHPFEQGQQEARAAMLTFDKRREEALVFAMPRPVDDCL